jgi:hypothetical protein
MLSRKFGAERHQFNHLRGVPTFKSYVDAGKWPVGAVRGCYRPPLTRRDPPRTFTTVRDGEAVWRFGHAAGRSGGLPINSRLPDRDLEVTLTVVSFSGSDKEPSCKA